MKGEKSGSSLVTFRCIWCQDLRWKKSQNDGVIRKNDIRIEQRMYVGERGRRKCERGKKKKVRKREEEESERKRRKKKNFDANDVP